MIATQTPAPTATCGAFDLACQAGRAVTSGFATLVDGVARGTADLVVSATTWWTTTDSVDPTDPAVIAAQGELRPLMAAILVGSILTQAIRVILSRKGEPLVQVVLGLLRFALVSALGLTVLQAALRAGDVLARDVLHDAAGNFALFLRAALIGAPLAPGSWFVMLLGSLMAAILAVVQWVLMALRQAGLLVLAAMLPLAASGSLTRATQGWLPRLMSWLLAIVVYKPAAAFIYYIGFTYLSTRATAKPGDIATMITGLMVLGLAVVAMPVLLKFFSWSGAALAGGSGGGSGLLGAAGAVVMARGGRGLPVDRAHAMETTGPGTGPSGAAPGAGRAAATGPAAGGAAAAGTGAAGGAAAGGAAAAGAGAAAAAAGPAGIAVAAAQAARGAAQGAAGRMAGPPSGEGTP